METKREIIPQEIHDEDSSGESTTSEDLEGICDMNGDFESVCHNQSNVNDDSDPNSCSSSPSDSESIHSISSAETVDVAANARYFQQEPKNKTFQEEENYDHSSSGAFKQQERMVDPMPDTASNFGSEPPAIEDRGPSSLDNDVEYVVNPPIGTMKSAKERDVDCVMKSVKKLNEKSLTKNNIKSSSLEEENKLLKVQLKESQKKCNGLSERIRNLMSYGTSTKERLQNKIDELKNQIKRENSQQKDEEVYKKQLDEYDARVKVVERRNQELTEQLKESEQASQANDVWYKCKIEEYEKQLNDLKEKLITQEKRYKEKKYELQQKMTSMEKEHRKDAASWTKTKETLTKKNSQLQSMIDSGEVPDQQMLSFSINSGDSSLNTSTLDDEENKSFKAPVYYNRSDSKLATIDVRFVEGMVKFIEGKHSSSNLYKNNHYIEWFNDMVKRMDPNKIYQTERHIFLKREFVDALISNDRQLSFTTFGPRKLSFGRMKCETRSFRKDGWPNDIDYMLVLHPDKAEFKELPRSCEEDDQGDDFFQWSTNVGNDFFRETENKNYLLLCAYKKEENK